MRLAVVLGCSLLAVACSIGETSYDHFETPAQKVSAVKTCSGAFMKPDLSTLTPCGNDDAKGHCYEGAKTRLTDLPACTGSGDTCIPDKVLEANGGTLKSCTFFLNGKPGVCMNLLTGQIAAHKGQMQPDVCEPNERCTPCIDPTNQQDTHLCDPIGVHVEKCQGGAAVREPTCCHGQGKCLNPDAIPEESREDMSADICKGGRLCAPAALVDGSPESCSVLGASGVCVDLCFAKMLGPSKAVMRGGCGPTSVCLPCVIGKGQGMPGCD